MGTFDQSEYDVRLEWGIKGVELLAPVSDVIIIVDVLSFSTCVDVALGRNATVYPNQFHDESATAFAAEKGALLASKRSKSESSFSLSPASLQHLQPGSRLVLPSPNGSTLSLATGNAITLCGCLRNAKAVALAAMQVGKTIAVIAAGEKWPDGSLRPAYEDLLGAGAILANLTGTLSPEASAALAMYEICEDIPKALLHCSSGKELIAMGFEEDVNVAASLNLSDIVPRLKEGAYQAL